MVFKSWIGQIVALSAKTNVKRSASYIAFALKGQYNETNQIKNAIKGKQKIKTKDIISEAITLPVEERTMVVDSILRSMNPTETEIDKKWAQTAKLRLKELRSGEKISIPGNEVFSKICNRYPL